MLKPPIENQVDRIEDPHLALRQARKTVAPQVVPDREPTRAQRLAQETHQAHEKLGDIATDRHLAADADRPEPRQREPPAEPALPPPPTQDRTGLPGDGSARSPLVLDTIISVRA